MIKTSPSIPNPTNSERRPNDAAAESRQALLEFRVNTPDPVWSSHALEDYVSNIVCAGGDSLEGVFVPVSKLLVGSHVALSQTIGHFIKDLVILSFTQHRSAYDSTDWASFIASLGQEPIAAQCYLALLALPPEKMASSLEDQIMGKLGDTQFGAEAKAMLDKSP